MTKPTQIRDEYKAYRQQKDRLITESALGWFEENVVLVNEQIDRSTVRRIISAITKFDETFGPFKSKISALASQIDAAEEALQKILTGKANDKKASDMLKRLSYLYSTFSRFFNSDLPVLLSSHLFLAPKENPDVKLNVLHSDKAAYNASSIRDALKYALTPSKDEQKLINTIYSGRSMPLVDATLVANQLVGLSFNELKELTNIGKVPMIATPPPPAAPAPEAPAAPAQEAVNPIQPAANQEEAVAPAETLNEEEDEAKPLDEAKLLDEAMSPEKIETLMAQLLKLQAAFAPYKDKMKAFNNTLRAINVKIAKARGEDKGLWSKIWTPNVMRDVLNIYDMLKNFNTAWTSKVKPLLADYPENWPVGFGKVTPEQKKAAKPEDLQHFEDISNAVEKMMVNELGRKSMFARKPVVPPADLVGELTNLSKAELDNTTKGLPVLDTAKVNPDPQLATGSTAAPGKPAAPTGENPATPTAEPAATGQPAKTQPGGTPAAGAPQTDAELKKIASDVVKKARLPKAQADSYQAFMKTVTKYGYKIVPSA